MPIPGGAAACRAIRDQLLTREYEQVLYALRHRMSVDAYCLQHPDDYCTSAKSLAAHLCGLCIAFEHANNPAILRGLQQWLSTNPKLHKPELPAGRGALTIAVICGLDDPAAYSRAIEAWARSVWDAYYHLHGIARDWLAQSRSISRA